MYAEVVIIRNIIQNLRANNPLLVELLCREVTLEMLNSLVHQLVGGADLALHEWGGTP